MWGRYGRKPIVLLALVGLIDAIDKGILPGVITAVQDDLGFSDFQIGLLESAFVIASFAIALPAGYLADRRSRTKIISGVMASWAAISALTATVQNFGQFFAVRAALGVGETVDDPASSSLVADYYPARIRGRAYSYQRVTGTLGRALGIVLGGVVGALVGWRAAFLLVGVPGSLLAIAIWRMKEPERGESDREESPPTVARPEPESVVEAPVAAEPVRRNRLAAARELATDVRAAFSIGSLRALVIGTAIAQGALGGFAFWAVAFHERHNDMNAAQAAGLTGAIIMVGAIVGTLTGGRIADRMRPRSPGAPMTWAGISLASGGSLLAVSFVDGMPLAAQLPMQSIGVGLVVAALPATTAMTSEVVSARLRGTAFSLTRVLSSLIAAFSPSIIGLLADSNPVVVSSPEDWQVLLTGSEVVKGNLGLAFILMSPVLVLGAIVLFRGRSHVEGDIARALSAGLDPAGPTSMRAAADTPTPTRRGVRSMFRRGARDESWVDALPGRLRRLAVLLTAAGVGLAAVGGIRALGAESVDRVPYLISGVLVGAALAGLAVVAVFAGRAIERELARRDALAEAEAVLDEVRRDLV